jgi:hypothetical protein
MTLPKQWPVAAAILGLVAVIGTGVKLVTSSNPLEARVDELLARERESTSSNAFENLQSRIDDLSSVQTNPGFTKLPVIKQQAVREQITELRSLQSYHDFEKKLSEIPDLKTARTARQLFEIFERLSQLQEPENLPEPLKHGEAIQQRRERIEDASALNTAADQIGKDYQKILSSGNLVLDKKNEPNLPDRIRDVLTSAKNLKTPEKNKNEPLPGSDRLTYAWVFQLAEIKTLLDEWIKLKEKLEPAGKMRK